MNNSYFLDKLIESLVLTIAAHTLLRFDYLSFFLLILTFFVSLVVIDVILGKISYNTAVNEAKINEEKIIDAIKRLRDTAEEKLKGGHGLRSHDMPHRRQSMRMRPSGKVDGKRYKSGYKRPVPVEPCIDPDGPSDDVKQSSQPPLPYQRAENGVHFCDNNRPVVCAISEPVLNDPLESPEDYNCPLTDKIIKNDFYLEGNKKETVYEDQKPIKPRVSHLAQPHYIKSFPKYLMTKRQT